MLEVSLETMETGLGIYSSVSENPTLALLKALPGEDLPESIVLLPRLGEAVRVVVSIEAKNGGCDLLVPDGLDGALPPRSASALAAVGALSMKDRS